MRALLLALALTACARPLPGPEPIVQIVASQVDRAVALLIQLEPASRACATPALLGDKPCVAIQAAYVRLTAAVVQAKRAVVLGVSAVDVGLALETLAQAGASLVAATDLDGGA